jgi:hypothetical protein
MFSKENMKCVFIFSVYFQFWSTVVFRYGGLMAGRVSSSSFARFHGMILPWPHAWGRPHVCENVAELTLKARACTSAVYAILFTDWQILKYLASTQTLIWCFPWKFACYFAYLTNLSSFVFPLRLIFVSCCKDSKTRASLKLV